MAHIYKITNPKGKVYVGSAVDIKRRFRKYKSLNCSSQHKIYNSLIKYGVENHKFEIITECSNDEMYKMEAVYGHMYDVLGVNGLNLALPKHEDIYQCKSEETRQNMSKAGGKNKYWLGKKRSDETNQKISASLVERCKRPEIKKLLSEQRKNTKRSKEHIDKIIEGVKKAAKNGSYKNIKNNTKKVVNTITGEIYNTCKEACGKTKYSTGHFTYMLQGKKKNNTPFAYVQ